MALRIVRGVWFISTFAALGILLLIYAALPEEVFLFQQGIDYISVSKETFFYLTLAFLTLLNSLVYVVKALFEKDETFRAWFHGLIITLNIFFVITLFFLNATNGSERFDFTRIGYLIYGSVLLVGLWALSWPVILIVRKFLPKHVV
jgi:hypothetical protein